MRIQEETDMSIVDPSVLELLNHADSRYTLVVEASKRAREVVSFFPRGPR